MTTEAQPAAEPPWLAQAREYDGLSEKLPGGEPNPRIAEFFQATKFKQGDADDAWCSAFMCHVFGELGIAHPHSARARDWLGWGVPLIRPKLGCVIVFRRPDNVRATSYRKGFGHVGLWLRDASPRWAEVYGGNQNQRVGKRLYANGDVLGWRWLP